VPKQKSKREGKDLSRVLGKEILENDKTAEYKFVYE
jgi:hypothetical protein